MPIPVVPVAPPPPPPPPPPPQYPGWTLAFEKDGKSIRFELPWPHVKFAKLDGATGLDLAPRQIESDPLPDGDGSVLRSIRRGERELFFPLKVKDVNYPEMQARVAELYELVRDLQPVDVVITQPTGERRRISALYAAGAEGSYSKEQYGLTWRTFGLTFVALDPFWRGDQVAPPPFRVDVALARPFLSTTVPFFPVILGSSTVAGLIGVTNPGDVDAEPVWEVTGPGTGPVTLTHVGTGKLIELTGAVPAGETYTVDTRRGIKDVFDGAGDDLWDRVSLGSLLWTLPPGESQVQVTMPGATSASSVALRFEPRYESGHH